MALVLPVLPLQSGTQQVKPQKYYKLEAWRGECLDDYCSSVMSALGKMPNMMPPATHTPATNQNAGVGSGILSFVGLVYMASMSLK